MDAQHFSILLAAFVPLALCIVVSNLGVIASVYSEGRLHTPPNFILASLALADFLKGSVAVTCELYADAKVNETDCQTEIYILAPSYLLSAVSVMHQIVVTVERLIAICCSLRYQEFVTKTRTIATLVTVWLVGVCVTCGYLYVWITSINESPANKKEKNGYCGGGAYLYSKTEKIKQFEIFIAVIVPAILIFLATSNLYMWRVAKRQVNQIKSHFRAMNIGRKRKRKRLRNIQATYTVLMIVGCFVISWTPYTVYVIYGVLWSREELGNTGILIMNQTAFFFIALNSAANPVIYGWKNNFLRQKLKDLICRRCYKQQVHLKRGDEQQNIAMTKTQRDENGSRDQSEGASKLDYEQTESRASLSNISLHSVRTDKQLK
ncbi:trace amine-associated receptor 1-like [Diadema antillarum]|uniref:trace amine-associated receptor 1-like n=1 Tax=Diadema antillarum TaxID=105358 RepID=UPI003A83EA31